MLATAKNITIFAPSNEAFSKLKISTPSIADSARNPAIITALLQYHVLSSKVMASGFTGSPRFAATMLAGAPSANVTGGQKVELVLEGGRATVTSGFKQAAVVTKADLVFDGGVLHIVDTVLTVPASPVVTALDTGLTSLAGALTRAKLVDAVNALMDATIFAPNNAAFQAVGSVVGLATSDPLAKVLEYHVLVNQVKFSTDLAMSGMSSMTFTTLLGEKITVRVEKGKIFVNSARVIIADIITSNGVMHVIDK